MQRVDCAGVQDLLGRGAQLVDVRTPMEFQQGALPGSVNLPVQAIQRAPRELDPQRPVIVYCRSGSRSAFAKSWLEAMGFREVVDLGAPYYFADCLRAERGQPERAPSYA